jgi:hypothetical protein
VSSIVRTRNSPGFQSDLTSWSYVVSESGKGFEEYQYSFLCGGQDLPTSYRTRFDQSEMEDLSRLISEFDTAPAFDRPDFIMDDVEHIVIETLQRTYSGQATTIAWMVSKRELPWGGLPSLMPVLRLYQFFRGRLHYEAFSGIDCRPFIAADLHL